MLSTSTLVSLKKGELENLYNMYFYKLFWTRQYLKNPKSKSCYPFQLLYLYLHVSSLASHLMMPIWPYVLLKYRSFCNNTLLIDPQTIAISWILIILLNMTPTYPVLSNNAERSINEFYLGCSQYHNYGYWEGCLLTF